MKLLLILGVLLVLIFMLGARWGFGRQKQQTRFAPVSQLPVDVQERIDTALRTGDRAGAEETYRAATGAGAAQAQAAIKVYAAGPAR